MVYITTRVTLYNRTNVVSEILQVSSYKLTTLINMNDTSKIADRTNETLHVNFVMFAGYLIIWHVLKSMRSL